VPSERDHLAVAEGNQKAIEWLLSSETDFPAWVTTVAFYKALHLVDALLDRRFKAHGYSHRARQQVLKTTNSFRSIYRHYRFLRGASEIARYLCDNQGGKEYRTFSDYMPMSQVRSEILGHRLRQLERSVRKMLGD